MSQSRIYFNHTTKLQPVKEGLIPAATVALQRDGDVFKYGIAICSRYDNFSKKHGREIATQRLAKNFGVLEIPAALSALPEKALCLTMLYNLIASTVMKSNKWKSRVTQFNISNKQQAKVVYMSTLPETPAA